MTYHDLHSKLHEQPFQPFRIVMVSGQEMDILDPCMAIVGKLSAVVATRTSLDEQGVRYAVDWTVINISHILDLPDVPVI